MTDLFDTGGSWLVDQLLTFAAKRVEYRRGAKSATIKAVFGRSRFEVADATGAIKVEWSDCDFIVAAADLRFGNNRIEPARGDRILHTQGGTTYTYEVMSPGQEPVWRWYDPSKQAMRIHTKLVRKSGS